LNSNLDPGDPVGNDFGPGGHTGGHRTAERSEVLVQWTPRSVPKSWKGFRGRIIVGMPQAKGRGLARRTNDQRPLQTGRVAGGAVVAVSTTTSTGPGTRDRGAVTRLQFPSSRLSFFGRSRSPWSSGSG
jgi:hypothetical protein